MENDQIRIFQYCYPGSRYQASNSENNKKIPDGPVLVSEKKRTYLVAIL